LLPLLLASPGKVKLMSWDRRQHRPLPYQESSPAPELLRLVLELPLPSVHVRYRPLAVAAIVTQLVIQRG
jgi:hypothetical protein